MFYGYNHMLHRIHICRSQLASDAHDVFTYSPTAIRTSYTWSTEDNTMA